MTTTATDSAAAAETASARECPRRGPNAPSSELRQEQTLFLPAHKKTIVQYTSDGDGNRELHLYYGDKEIAFDEPALFPFGEQLARHSQFIAGAAASWGGGYPWETVKPLLEQLVSEGVLRCRKNDGDDGGDPAVLNPLPKAAAARARSWLDCEAVLQELTGRALETGYLEMVVPVFQVAHIALDREGRQVGEANVFPKALRLAIPTEWHGCPFPGSRYQAGNKSAHWRPVPGRDGHTAGLY